MNGRYILVGKEPKQVDDLIEWAKSFEDKESRIVQQTQIIYILVSTVFLGLDHNFGSGAPILFETMIFGGIQDGYQKRYSTWDDAVEGHKSACEIAID